MDKISLYFAPGTCARVPMTALEEAGVEFDSKVVAFRAGEHRSAEFLRLNPKGKVPALVIGNHTVTENVAILPLLSRLFPEARLLPRMEDPWVQSRVLADLSFCASGLHPLVTRLRLPQTFCTAPGAAKEVWNIAAAAMKLQFEVVEQRLANGPWWYGAQWSVLDAYINWVWFRVVGAGFSVDEFPLFADHAARHEARPATRRALEREAVGQRELEERGLALVFKPVDELDHNEDAAGVFIASGASR